MAKTGFSTEADWAASDYIRLSWITMHFCTLYVDKIVSKAVQSSSSV